MSVRLLQHGCSGEFSIIQELNAVSLYCDDIFGLLLCAERLCAELSSWCLEASLGAVAVQILIKLAVLRPSLGIWHQYLRCGVHHVVTTVGVVICFLVPVSQVYVVVHEALETRCERALSKLHPVGFRSGSILILVRYLLV